MYLPRAEHCFLSKSLRLAQFAQCPHTRPSTSHPLNGQKTEAAAKRELQEAFSARDEAIGTSESARAAAEAAEDKLATEQDRAEAAERELTGCVRESPTTSWLVVSPCTVLLSYSCCMYSHIYLTGLFYKTSYCFTRPATIVERVPQLFFFDLWLPSAGPPKMQL